MTEKGRYGTVRRNMWAIGRRIGIFFLNIPLSTHQLYTAITTILRLFSITEINDSGSIVSERKKIRSRKVLDDRTIKNLNAGERKK
jgi:hypothetical protein